MMLQYQSTILNSDVPDDDDAFILINNVTHDDVWILFNDATDDATDDEMGNIFFNLKP